MSPRKNNILIVKAWPNLKKGKLYKGIVKKAKNKTQYVDIEIENLDPTQLGRIHEMHLASRCPKFGDGLYQKSKDSF